MALIFISLMVSDASAFISCVCWSGKERVIYEMICVHHTYFNARVKAEAH